MAINTIGKYPTPNGSTVHHLRDDNGKEGYMCTGCNTMILDADAQEHAQTCDK